MTDALGRGRPFLSGPEEDGAAGGISAGSVGPTAGVGSAHSSVVPGGVDSRGGGPAR